MDATNIINRNTLKYEFYRNPGELISIKLRGSDSTIGHVVEDRGMYAVSVNDAEGDFFAFVDGRPEFSVISKYWLKRAIAEYDLTTTSDLEADLKELRYIYITLLQGCALLRAQRNGVNDDGKVLTQLAKVLTWLDGTDFFRAPASTIYHESFPGGLVFHSLKVAATILEMSGMSAYRGKVHLEDAVLCALVHDWCKINRYESYMKNQKNETTDKWEKVAAYKYRKEIMVPLGHGETSMYIAMKMFNLSQEEAVAIRHHMGLWGEQTSYELNDLQYANENYPLCLLLQFADQLACVKF